MGSIPHQALLHNNFEQVIHPYVPVSPSSIIWHWVRVVMSCDCEGKPGGK